MHTYTTTDRRLHVLCQVIAKANRTYVPKKEDDSHTNLYFDSVSNRLTGRWIKSPKGKIQLSLKLEPLSFEIIDTSHDVLAEVSVVSKTVGTIEKEIEKLLPRLGLNPAGYTATLHYEISDYSFAGEPNRALYPDGLRSWKAYRTLANDSCFALLGYAQAWEEVRIWPHHFDTGIYFKAKDNIGVGFGLAMEDDMVGAPYFYLSAYPGEGEIAYENLPQGPWKWETAGQWKGATLSLQILDRLSDTQQKNLVQRFFVAGYNWMIKQ